MIVAVEVPEAQERLDELIDLALGRATVLILRDGDPVAQLVPYSDEEHGPA